ncbi:MAG: hypothetical protein HY042_06510, partial [Spirochaetia bacterium]|nr:hypothetical protein [Spirochaetia bacterium]
MVTFIQNVENRPTLAVAAAYFALEWLSGLSGYGFFGDELYYLACAAH